MQQKQVGIMNLWLVLRFSTSDALEHSVRFTTTSDDVYLMSHLCRRSQT